MGVPHRQAKNLQLHRFPPSVASQWLLRVTALRETHISKTVLLEEAVFLYVIIHTFSTTIKVEEFFLD